jgi:hypothetical protein
LPDFLLRGIDNAVAERVKSIARDRNWSINDVILHLMKQALGMTEEDIAGGHVAHQDIATLAGTWDPAESAAFRAALEAFERLPEEEPLAPRIGRPGG